jgi:hypothetical protein
MTLAAQRRRTKRARRFLENTCSASRHVHEMAECLASGKKYHMFEEDPKYCAESMLSVLESLWILRTESGWPTDDNMRQFELQNKGTAT